MPIMAIEVPILNKSAEDIIIFDAIIKYLDLI